MKQTCFILVITLGLLAGLRAWGQAAPHGSVEDQARSLVANGQAAQAIPLLKEAIERDPMSETLRQNEDVQRSATCRD